MRRSAAEKAIAATEQTSCRLNKSLLFQCIVLIKKRGVKKQTLQPEER
jgi:hypothetical protein